MTPTKKGLYKQCLDCIHKINTEDKYPCTYSHRQVRKNSNSKLEREFTTCGLREVRDGA